MRRILSQRSAPDLTRRLTFLGPLALVGCGFVPAYGPGGAATRWQNAVAVNAPNSVFGFRMRQQLHATLGQPDGAIYTLDVKPKTAPVPATITEEGDITRFNVTGNAEWVLQDAQTGARINEGLVQTFTSYAATGSTVATQSAESDARARLAVALADLIVQQILTTP